MKYVLELEKIKYLFLNYLYNILILKNMTKTAMLRTMPCTCAPYQNILHILYQAPVNVVTEIFNRAATSTLKSEVQDYTLGPCLIVKIGLVEIRLSNLMRIQ